jgi:hypothetical protein
MEWPAKSIDWKAKKKTKNQKPKGLNRIAKISYGDLYPREETFASNIDLLEL